MTEPVERTWANRFGDFWEVSMADKAGRIHSRVLMRSDVLGWPDKEAARAEVRQSVLAVDGG